MEHTSRSIVVVDDDLPVRVAICRLLTAAGLCVVAYESGQEYLTMIDTHPVDCVVLDLHMPQMNGFEVLDHMAERGMRLPVVVLTGNDTAESRQRAAAAGVRQYITKPVERRVILDAIDCAIKGTH